MSQALDILIAETSLAFEVRYLDGLKKLLKAKADRAELDTWLFLNDALELVHSERESFLEWPSYDVIPFFLDDQSIPNLFTALSTANVDVPLNDAGRLLAVGLSTGMTELAASTLEGLQVVTEERYGANTWSLYKNDSAGLSYFDAITADQDATAKPDET